MHTAQNGRGLCCACLLSSQQSLMLWFLGLHHTSDKKPAFLTGSRLLSYHGRLLCRKYGNLADSSVMLLCLCSAADVPTLLQAPRASAARCSRLSCRS